ncbi:hypothetical protein U8527_18130 [Kordia algicida OT-1]|uniref:Uncharacterized protein n=1 Tax=Kordia algicida OT-1 TaxID=391587 RepID=A9DII9_9FLAO|nr:hypothetical protein [Kordia algicida]EDP97911.1 hypothetical protein KAOT1_11877 [Kordia algicida OT-1]
MRQEISVNKAIKRGHLMVNVPVTITLIGCPALAFYLSKQNLIPSWGIAVGFVIGFLVAWLIWSYMITKWRIWAFENVRNVHELKKRAVQEKLIWEDGSMFEKTEIRNWEDKQKLKKLERKFEKEDVYREDHNLPPKTEIYYSKTHNYVELSVSLLLIGVGSFLLFGSAENSPFYGGALFAFGLYSLVKYLIKVSNTKPHIIIDANGIQTKNVAFKDWSVISEEEVLQEGYGNTSKSFLGYCYHHGNEHDYFYEKIEINELNVDTQMLENILRTYRIRYTKNKK